MEKKTLNSYEAAEMLGVSRPTFFKLCQREDFPIIRIGRAVRIPTVALERLMDTHIGAQVLTDEVDSDA